MLWQISIDNWTSQKANSFRFTPVEDFNTTGEKMKKFYLDNEGIEIVGPMEISLCPGICLNVDDK